MARRTFFSLLLVVIGLSLVRGIAQNLPRFDFPEAAGRWLWYSEYLNAFDSCGVQCSYGEFAIIAPDTTILVHLRLRYEDLEAGGATTRLRQGCNTQGRDTVLE